MQIRTFMYLIKVKVVLFTVIVTIIVLLAPPLLNSQWPFLWVMHGRLVMYHVPRCNKQHVGKFSTNTLQYCCYTLPWMSYRLAAVMVNTDTNVETILIRDATI